MRTNPTVPQVQVPLVSLAAGDERDDHVGRGRDMSAGQETSPTQNCLEHLRPDSAWPLRLTRTRQPSATWPMTSVLLHE
jgi:hypothetical protein